MSESLSDRMKMFEQEFYSPEMGYVDQNMPTFVRIDGKAFHTWVKSGNIQKPFDVGLSEAFQEAAKWTCRTSGQILMAYGQSDEVTFLLNGWANPDSQLYFGGKIQKIVSVMSSIFTAYFNNNSNIYGMSPAFFDARVFNVPEKEIENVFIWRQMDAKRNSIQALARSLYSQPELHSKNQDYMINMCNEKGILWDNLSPLQKWGFVVYKETFETACGNGMVTRSQWKVDTDIPFFIDDKNYFIDKYKGE